jgi:nucleoid-associated protein YgaU
MDLRAKYDHAIQTAKRLRFDGSAQQEGDKLNFRGIVHSEDEKNQIWTAIKTVPEWQTEIVADIKVQALPAGRVTEKTYTVQAGDTLGKIAKAHLGDAAAYMKIFEANKDQLTDPDKIKPGQVLKIPSTETVSSR